METLGACMVGNDLPFTGQAKDIFQRRVNGESWAKIAEDYGLGSPNAARKLFKNLTGISDFKVKGADLIKLAKGDLTPNISKIEKIVKPKTKVAEKANVPKEKFLKDMKGEYVDPPKTTFAQNKQVGTMFNEGKTYAQIAQKTGLSFEDIDGIIYNKNLAKHHEDVWKAWKEKTNSKNAVDNVKKTVHKARSEGWTTTEIEDVLGVPKDVQAKIFKGEWDPTTIPHQFPKPTTPKTYSKASEPPSQYSTMTPKPKPGGDIKVTGNGVDFDHNNFPVADGGKLRFHNRNLTPDAESAVKNYTGSNYVRINGELRGKYPSTPQTQRTIRGIDKSMRETTQNMTFTRGMDRHGFQLGYIDNDTILNLTGKVVSDPGYFSTSASESAAFGGEVKFIIEAPKGTKGVYAAPLSIHPEREFLLARGTNIMITGVSQKTSVHGTVSFIVKGRVIV